MAYEGGYTSAINSESQRASQETMRRAQMQQMVQAAMLFQQQQQARQRQQQARASLAEILPELAQIGRPPDGAQPSEPGVSSQPAPQPAMGQLPPPPGIGFATPPPAAASAAPKPPGAGPGAPMAAGSPGMGSGAAQASGMGVGGWKPLPKPPAPPSASPDGISPPPESAVLPRQAISVSDLAKLLASKGIKGEKALDMIDEWKPYMDSQNKAELDAMRLQATAQAAALRAYTGVVRQHEQERHNQVLERQGEQRVAQGQQRINAKGAGGAGSKMSDDAIDDAATQFRKTGVIPSAFRDKDSRALVQNRAAEQRRELGTTAASEVGDRVDLKAVQSAYTAITKDLASIRPYKVMLDKNGDIAIDLAKKAIATDTKFVNKSLNWLRQNATDNPDVAEFLAQARIISTEAARVLNNPRLVGQLTDSARHEMEEIINGDMPLQSFTRVIQRMQKDGENRVAAMTAEADDLKKRAGGGSAAPSGGKSKSEYIELRTLNGKTLGKKADGTIEEVK